MAPNFKFYRILCCTPPDLESERLVFEAAVAHFVEQVSMPDHVLIAPASLRPPIQAAVQKTAIEGNIRMCEWFLQIYGEQLPDPVFQGFVEYALQCAADPLCVADQSGATRKVAVLFRNYESAAPDLRRFRQTLADDARCTLGDFHVRGNVTGNDTANDTGDLSKRLSDLLSSWYASLKRPSDD